MIDYISNGSEAAIMHKRTIANAAGPYDIPQRRRPCNGKIGCGRRNQVSEDIVVFGGWIYNKFRCAVAALAAGSYRITRRRGRIYKDCLTCIF
ncbi:MAG: hypothetical protein ABIX01_01765 [Chitinophagaceae bacterium]